MIMIERQRCHKCGEEFKVDFLPETEIEGKEMDSKNTLELRLETFYDERDPDHAIPLCRQCLGKVLVRWATELGWRIRE
jgi:hypothetical protein